MIIKPIPSTNAVKRFSIAPMLDCTDSHFRVMMRFISKKAFLYTEMVVAQALYHSKNKERLLDFEEIEHPIALQIGGDDPRLLSEAAKMAADWGYDEINLNIGCPSPKVTAGNFGACLMSEPELVARCVEAMNNASKLPISVKHRIGIDNFDSHEFLKTFVETVANSGVQRFIIHARKAFLKGLDPKQNRIIPPLQYDRVQWIKEQFPCLIIELNGGLDTPIDCVNALKKFDGVMVGRSAYSHPLRWQLIDEMIYKEQPQSICASQIIKDLIPYAEKHLNKNGRLWNISKHILQLVEGIPGARSWRRDLAVATHRKNAGTEILIKAAQRLEDAGQ